MALTVVVNRASSSYDVYIGRPSIYGNPYVIGRDGTRSECILKYKHYFDARVRTDTEFKAAVERLRGRRIGCSCKPRPCHGDVIAVHLNTPSLF